MKDLLEIPKNESKYTVKYILKSLTVAVVGIAIGSRFYLSTRKLSYLQGRESFS